MITESLLDECAAALEASSARRDPDYPSYHLAPPIGRLNDPNGLVIVDGVYHAFYQFGPFFPERNLVFWGHASSTDLLTWQTHPPAIAPSDPYDQSGAYSGGATVADGRVWLHYTGNVKHGDVRESYQCAVTSSDLVTFDKHPANPLIPGPPPGYTTHLRDPQIMTEGDGYRMLLGAQRADETGCILSYHSPDLVQWNLQGEIEFHGTDGYDDFGFMWECPNLLRVPDSQTGEVHDVLIFCPQGVGPIGDSFRNIFPCGYLVGRLDGLTFHPSGPFTELDRGFEFYAPQAFRRANSEDGEPPILLGWLGNASEDDQPSLADHGWVHMMTIPRRLTLRDGVLLQRPAVDLFDQPVRGNVSPISPLPTIGDLPVRLHQLTGRDSFALRLDVDQSRTPAWRLRLSGGAGSAVLFDFTGDTLTVDRSHTRYPHGDRRTIAAPRADRLRIELLHDRSVVELFLGDGHTAFSLRSYLEPGLRSVELSASGALDVLAGRVTIL